MSSRSPAGNAIAGARLKKKTLQSQRAYASVVVPAKRFMFPAYDFAANHYWPEKKAAAPTGGAPASAPAAKPAPAPDKKPRTKGRINAVAYIFFFPAMILLFYASVDEAWASWKIGDLSEQTAWRPILWPFKAIVPLSSVLLLIQGISEFRKWLYAARTGQFLTKVKTIQI